MKMLVTISLEILKQTNLSPNDFIYLYNLYHNLELPEYPVDLIKLQEKKFIKITKSKIYPRWYNIEKLFVEAPIQQISPISIKADVLQNAWEKLTAVYPKKYGGRYLHDIGKAKPKLKLALQIHKIEDIVQGAANENLAREAGIRTTGWFDPPKGLSSWIFQEHWLTYLDYEKEVVQSNIRRV